MNWNWQTIKEQAQTIYAKGSQLVVFLGFCFYLLACVVAAKPCSPRDYVAFTYHVFQWKQPRLAAAVLRAATPPVLAERLTGQPHPAEDFDRR